MRSAKAQVLLLLEQSRGKPISGQKISDSLGITRSAVWKAVNDLRQEGYQVQAVTNKGYTLSHCSDILSPQGISPYLNCRELDGRIQVEKRLSSTNTALKQKAVEGLPAPAVLIAQEQTQGRGRRGRSFYSPAGHGIYCSLLLRPQGVSLSQAPLYTTAAAVAVCRGVEEVCEVSLSIKWVNDLFLQDRKICGILTEAVTDFETGQVEFIILGFGLNISQPDHLPPELDGQIIALEEVVSQPVRKNQLCGSILNHMMALTSALPDASFLEEYRGHSLLLGRMVTVSQGESSYQAKAVDVGSDGSLILEDEAGRRSPLFSGEVSVSPVAPNVHAPSD